MYALLIDESVWPVGEGEGGRKPTTSLAFSLFGVHTLPLLEDTGVCGDG